MVWVEGTVRGFGEQGLPAPCWYPPGKGGPARMFVHTQAHSGTRSHTRAHACLDRPHAHTPHTDFTSTGMHSQPPPPLTHAHTSSRALASLMEGPSVSQHPLKTHPVSNREEKAGDCVLEPRGRVRRGPLAWLRGLPSPPRSRLSVWVDPTLDPGAGVEQG